MTRQTRIPCVIQRGGTSKGPYFLASDLPANPALRDRVLLSVMGSPDARQIDGLGGADPLTSKVAIVSKSSIDGVDLDYLFCQVKVDEPLVDVTPNCGNMLAGVAPFALEHGLVSADDGRTTVRIHMVNSGNLCANIFYNIPVIDFQKSAEIQEILRKMVQKNAPLPKKGPFRGVAPLNLFRPISAFVLHT